MRITWKLVKILMLRVTILEMLIEWIWGGCGYQFFKPHSQKILPCSLYWESLLAIIISASLYHTMGLSTQLLKDKGIEKYRRNVFTNLFTCQSSSDVRGFSVFSLNSSRHVEPQFKIFIAFERIF